MSHYKPGTMIVHHGERTTCRDCPVNVHGGHDATFPDPKHKQVHEKDDRVQEANVDYSKAVWTPFEFAKEGDLEFLATDEPDIDPDAPKKATDRQVGGEHYSKNKIQPIDYIVENELDWFSGNVVKYITRFKHKGGKQDLEKVIHYAQLAMEHYYPEQK